MPRPGLRDDKTAKRTGATLKYVDTSFTTTGLATAWAPTSGKFLRIYQVDLEAYVTTVLASATIGDRLRLCDNVVGNFIKGFAFDAATTATRAAQGGSIVSATDAITVHYGRCQIDFGPYGVRLGTVSNALKVGLSATITTGVIAVTGFVVGIEEDPYDQ